MKRRSYLSITALLVVAIGLPAQQVTGADVAPTGARPQAVDSSGIPIVRDVVQARPGSEEQAQALSDALEFAEAHPDDVGYPWIEPTSGQLQLSAASAAGSGLLDAGRSALPVASTTRGVKFSFGRLEEIKHEVTTLNAAGVPDADLIYATSPDDQSNRIVITVSAPSTRLFQELARRYGTEAIAVQIDPTRAGGSSASRNNDTNRYWGGALITGVERGVNCSDSFSWIIGGASGNAMLTAAHCAPNGQVIKIGSGFAGTVAASSEENWSSTTGTTYYSGQSTYRGDVALIRLYSTLGSDPEIYRGGPTSITHSHVITTLRRYAAVGDVVYVGGAKNGETGYYSVDNRRMDWWYSNDGPSVWARNVSRATHPGITCASQGDSGGSVFSIVAGGVMAAGTYSGFGFGTCNILYTNIYDSYLALPGDVTLY